MDQTVIEHRDLSASVSLVLELKLRASLLSFVLFFFFFLLEIGRPSRATVGFWEGRGVRVGGRVFFGSRNDRCLGGAFRPSYPCYDFV